MCGPPNSEACTFSVCLGLTFRGSGFLGLRVEGSGLRASDLRIEGLHPKRKEEAPYKDPPKKEMRCKSHTARTFDAVKITVLSAAAAMADRIIRIWPMDDRPSLGFSGV